MKIVDWFLYDRDLHLERVNKSVETEGKVMSIIKQIIELMRFAGIHLTKIECNSKFLMECLPAENVGQ